MEAKNKASVKYGKKRIDEVKKGFYRTGIF